MIRPRQILLLVLLMQFPKAFVVAQDIQAITSYRVVAFKKGGPSIRSISNDIEMVLNTGLYIPNTFTPNGDNLNDTFSAVGGRISSYSMLIFNRWGQLLYETDDINAPWDGTYDGEKVPPDSYVYKIFAKGTQLGEVHKTGTVTVLL